MNRISHRLLISAMTLFALLGLLLTGAPAALAEEAPLILTVDALTDAMVNAKDGDTILVGDITFNPMPMGMIVVTKNVTIKSGKATNAVFTNATFALNGSTSDSSPLTVRFENIDFRGDLAGVALDPGEVPNVSASMPGLMKTMCAAMFKMNVDAAYVGCTFEGYHYGYGGVFNAIYSSEDNKNALKLTLEGCAFRNNAAKYGGSLYLSGYSHNISLEARDCVFETNAAATGGAVWAQDSDLHLLNCSFVGNRYLNTEVSTPDGGALALYNCGAELDGCILADNAAGSRGAGIYCEISPFKTLVMQNCTAVGNIAPEDEGISIALSKTNFDTPAVAHLYFSSLFGEQKLADHAELFGCLLVCGSAAPAEPGEENGWCLTLTPEAAREKGLFPAEPGHILLIKGEYPVSKAAADRIAGGKFANSLGTLRVGDNYEAETVIVLEPLPGHSSPVTVGYGQTLTLEQPQRDGYAFEGWEYPAGTALSSGKVFYGGDLPEGSAAARWRFLLSEHLYLIWGPVLVLICAGAGIFLVRKTKAAPVGAPKPAAKAAQEPAAEEAAAETAALPQDWIDRVCESPEIAQLLSRRETEVLRKLLEGKSRRQIAEELFVTESTVKKHSTSIYAKLEVSGRVELVSKMAQK